MVELEEPDDIPDLQHVRTVQEELHSPQIKSLYKCNLGGEYSPSRGSLDSDNFHFESTIMAQRRRAMSRGKSICTPVRQQQQQSQFANHVFSPAVHTIRRRESDNFLS